MDRKEVESIIKKFAEKVRKSGINVYKVILFGSYASGENKEWSDIDVAIISEDFGKNRFEERLLLSRLAVEIDPRIEAHPVGKEEYEKEGWNIIVREIKKHGIEIAA